MNIWNHLQPTIVQFGDRWAMTMMTACCQAVSLIMSLLPSFGPFWVSHQSERWQVRSPSSVSRDVITAPLVVKPCIIYATIHVTTNSSVACWDGIFRYFLPSAVLPATTVQQPTARLSKVYGSMAVSSLSFDKNSTLQNGCQISKIFSGSFLLMSETFEHQSKSLFGYSKQTNDMSYETVGNVACQLILFWKHFSGGSEVGKSCLPRS